MSPSHGAGNLRYAVAVDTGGTFTDVTLFDRETGRVWTAKTPSTPEDPSRGFMTGIEMALTGAALTHGDLAQVFHGTTIATNLILEGKGAKAALLTTEGFKHVLEIGRQDIPRRANLFTWVKPKRPVPPQRVLEISERTDVTGNLLEDLNQDQVRCAARLLRERGVDAVAICFLNSFANPTHERRAAELVRDAHPAARISISSDVLRVFREYERSIATVLNVYVMPAVSHYMAELEARLKTADVTAPLLIMKSNGGVVGASEVQQVPAQTALSGPAAGVVGARFAGQSAGFPDVVGIDIGGTSADVCLIKDGEYALTGKGKIGDWPLAFPMLDINTIGTGGGSIARVSDTGALTVGPHSAGATPGPACYGKGGEAPTITDAHVVLGHLPPYLLAGGMALDIEASRRAVHDRVAKPMRLSVEESARGILSIADNDMVGAIRVVSVERGHDPRDFALVPFGGAGPLHGGSLARLLGIRTVLIPPAPGVLSSIGLLVSQLRSDYSRTCPQTPPDFDYDLIAETFRALEQEAENWFDREHVPQHARTLTRFASMRYRHQGFELDVPWTGDGVTPDSVNAALDAFHALHEQLYTFAQRDTPVEMVTLQVRAVGDLLRPRLRELPPGGALEEAVVGRQTVHYAAGPREVTVYEREKLPSESEFAGPALVLQLDTTTLVHEDQRARVDRLGNLILEFT